MKHTSEHTSHTAKYFLLKGVSGILLVIDALFIILLTPLFLLLCTYLDPQFFSNVFPLFHEMISYHQWILWAFSIRLIGELWDRFTIISSFPCVNIEQSIQKYWGEETYRHVLQGAMAFGALVFLGTIGGTLSLL